MRSSISGSSGYVIIACARFSRKTRSRSSFSTSVEVMTKLLTRMARVMGSSVQLTTKMKELRKKTTPKLVEPSSLIAGIESIQASPAGSRNSATKARSNAWKSAEMPLK